MIIIHMQLANRVAVFTSRSILLSTKKFQSISVIPVTISVRSVVAEWLRLLPSD